MSRNKYIVIEGLDYSGKSSVISSLHSRLNNVCVVREPGGTLYGEAIRKLILEDQTPTNRFDPETELLAMMSQRNHLFNKVIHPALNEGKTVLSDRSIASTYVYQVNDANVKLFDALLPNLPLIIMPSYYVYLDIDYPTYLRRFRVRHAKHQMFDNIDEATFNKRRYRYMDFMDYLGDAKTLCIDTSNTHSPVDVANRVYDNLLNAGFVE